MIETTPNCLRQEFRYFEVKESGRPKIVEINPRPDSNVLLDTPFPSQELVAILHNLDETGWCSKVPACRCQVKPRGCNCNWQEMCELLRGTELTNEFSVRGENMTQFFRPAKEFIPGTITCRRSQMPVGIANQAWTMRRQLRSAIENTASLDSAKLKARKSNLLRSLDRFSDLDSVSESIDFSIARVRNAERSLIHSENLLDTIHRSDNISIPCETLKILKSEDDRSFFIEAEIHACFILIYLCQVLDRNRKIAECWKCLFPQSTIALIDGSCKDTAKNESVFANYLLAEIQIKGKIIGDIESFITKISKLRKGRNDAAHNFHFTAYVQNQSIIFHEKDSIMGIPSLSDGFGIREFESWRNLVMHLHLTLLETMLSEANSARRD